MHTRPIPKLLDLLDALGEPGSSLTVHGIVAADVRFREVRILASELRRATLARGVTDHEKLHAGLEKLLIEWESVAADTNWNGHIRSGYEACAKDVRKLLTTFAK